jgi:hypothetical protein
MPKAIWSLIRDYVRREMLVEHYNVLQPLDPVVHNLQDVLWRKESRPSCLFFTARMPGSVR